jgi:N utilization substance protein B
MSSRHIARSIVFQTAFEWDFRNLTREQALESLSRNINEFGDNSEKPFAEALIKGIIDKKPDLDNIIGKAAPDWPIEKISNADRNILRIGLYELLFSDRKEVPAKVAINEAIELAKVYGGEKSGSFINGVLGTVYKELGEPGKEELSKRDKKNIPFDKMPVKSLAGAVVYSIKDGVIYLALVHDVFGRWTLSKGRIEEGENLKDSARKKIKEEIGIDINIEEELTHNEYIANHPQEGKIRKQVTYFLANAEMKDLKLGDSGGLDNAKWFKLEDIQGLNFYNDILPIITKAITIISKKVS